MERSVRILVTCSILLLVCMTLAGCSDSSSGSTETETAAAAATITPLFAAGDIVRSSSGSTSSGWLIISYDAAGDSYTRAFIYKNTDGTWGYRANSDTEESPRSVMEKVYTDVITHVSVSSVPVQTPTPVATATTVAVKKTTTVKTTATTSTPNPGVKDIDPEDGYAGESITVVIKGSYFDEDATVALENQDDSDIEATDVEWDSSTQLTCTFDIPDDATVGIWSIVVTNPNNKTGKLANYFMIHESSD